MVIKVYVSLTSGNFQIKNRQEKIRQVLDTLKIEYQEMDISDPVNEDMKIFMKENTPKKEGQDFVLPPQIFNEDQYCGDFEGFEGATENETVHEFLNLQKVSNGQELDANFNIEQDDAHVIQPEL